MSGETDRDVRPLTLGGRTFEVPRLPLEVTIVVYPICQRLTNAGLVQRLLDGEGGFSLTPEEIGDLTELAFQAARAADPELTTQAFLGMPVTPPELFAAFFVMRVQCGGWGVRGAAGAEDGDGAGEGEGLTPPTSTSTASSPSSSATSTSRKNTG